MKLKSEKTAPVVTLREAQRQAQIDQFNGSVNFKEVIRMKFLEQSARYLGAYVENAPKNALIDRVIN